MTRDGDPQPGGEQSPGDAAGPDSEAESGSGTVSPQSEAPQRDAQSAERDPEAPERASDIPGLLGSRIGGGVGEALRAGASGQQLTTESLLGAIGGWRGVFETIVPALLFLVIYIPTENARLAAVIPGALALLLVVIRLVRRETLVSALSGMLGVGVAVLITLITGRGVDYYLSGFVINTAWALGLFVSILVGWPLIGIAIGAFRGDIKGWRRDARLRRIARLLTLLWLAMFVARLAVQLPLYLSEQVAALGVARIAMGLPLFALVIVVTWFTARRSMREIDPAGEQYSSDDS